MPRKKGAGGPPGRWQGIADKTAQVSGAARAQTEARLEDAARRALASNILAPSEVAGDWDASRVLMTTLGGELRPITREDLKEFKKRAASVRRKFAGGIRAEQVVSLSRPEDRDRANREIRVATPAGANRGTIRFVTNAGPNSKVGRHYVSVELVGFTAAVSSPEQPAKAGKMLARTGAVKFDCDCGRHTFWYRYIADIGGFNAGRPETGFPKIRNPKLYGVACKHVLRVMDELQRSSFVHGFVGKMIERARSGQRQVLRVSQNEAGAVARKQVARPRQIGAGVGKKLAGKLSKVVASVPRQLAKLPNAKKSPEEAMKAFMVATNMDAGQILELLKTMKN